MGMFLFNKLWLVMVISTACVVTSAEPKPTHKSRVVDRQFSDEKHFKGEEHNYEYDHDAFVGKQEAKTFDELSPEESQKRLGLLFLKIDKDGDNRVSPAELQSWMRHIQRQSMDANRDKQWSELKLNSQDPDLLTWDEYMQHTYKDNKDDDEEDDEDEAAEIAHDEQRWKLADTDGDNKLNKEEFYNFLNPEDVPHMRDSLIQETLDEVDKDKDGMISRMEYLTNAIEGKFYNSTGPVSKSAGLWTQSVKDDIATEEDDEDDEDDDEENEAGWTAEDEEEFDRELDKDGDGVLNRDEIYQWLVPSDFDHVVDESDHLFSEADDDKDGYLSGQEMVDKYDVFVGSQATDYGNMLKHQEL